ncbi:hypothetical protein DVH24_024077 [Malus domestica]|uniref:RNase H type-1 domain-containing protein n=1 Tax=Malus domestica TaxID=3750 RepID=A0A498JKS2_MALDO|nr:hypothetical protein DVH24_024077 [Malus domestica]
MDLTLESLKDPTCKQYDRSKDYVDKILFHGLHGFSKVIFESDAKMIIQMLRKETPIDLSLECILGDIESLARRLTSVSFAYVSRESNFAAHSFAYIPIHI